MQGENKKFLAGKVGQLRCEKVINRAAGVDGDRVGAIPGGTNSKFEGRLKLTGLGKTKSVFFAKFLKVQPRQGDEAAMFAEELAADFDGAGTFCSGPQKDGKEFFIGEGPGTQRGHFLPGFLPGRQIMNALVIGHRNEASIFRADVASFTRGRKDDCVFRQ